MEENSQFGMRHASTLFLLTGIIFSDVFLIFVFTLSSLFREILFLLAQCDPNIGLKKNTFLLSRAETKQHCLSKTFLTKENV